MRSRTVFKMTDQLTILCPITSRGCESKVVAGQPLMNALLPSMDALKIRALLILGYDDDDPLWSNRANREGINAEWHALHGLTGNITGCWNALAKAAEPFDWLLPANDDLAFQTSPLPAIDKLKARNGFGTVAFHDAAFPDLPTFYVVGRMHFDIFGCLYPLPWTGAHQDPWIADVYRPWRASEIDQSIQVHNRIGITAPRFEYGAPPENYRAVVMDGRRKVNGWLGEHPGVAPVLPEHVIEGAPFLI